MRDTLTKSTSDILTSQINKVIDNMKDVLHLTISISEFDEAYEKFHAVIYRMNKELYEKHRMPTVNPNYYDLTSGAHYTIRVGRFTWIEVSAVLEDHYGSSHKTTCLLIYGKNKEKVRSVILKRILENTDDDIKIKNCGRYGSTSIYRVSPRALNSIVLPIETKKNLVAGLYGWWNSKDWYEKHHLIHKIGVLLYGEPGTGKSTIVKAISTMFQNAPIIIIKSTDVEDGLSTILREREKTVGPIIILFEDFDMFFYDRDQKPTNTNQTNEVQPGVVVTTSERNNSMTESQNLVFQMLDGNYSTDDTIYIATTNHIERLDKALIRYGRFDIQEEIKCFDKELTMKFLNQFGYGEGFFNKYLTDDDLPIQPAKLQAMIMKHRSMQIMKKRGGLS